MERKQKKQNWGTNNKYEKIHGKFLKQGPENIDSPAGR